MTKKLVWLAVLVGAVGLPPVVYHADKWWAWAEQHLSPVLALSDGPGQSPIYAPSAASLPDTLKPQVAQPRPPEPASPVGQGGGPGPARPSSVELSELFRFDVNPGWIMERWDWVSAGLSELPLQGYRVPLVTGTAENDLAGSLTYYFNARQQVQRITFQGTTGDAGKLIEFLITHYGFGRRLTNDPGLFRYELPVPKGPPKSYLDIRLVQPNAPYRRFHLALVLERPESR